MGLPSVVMLLALLLAACMAGATQLRLEEAARAGAREVARGETGSRVAETARRIAGPGAAIAVSAGNWSTVRVSSQVNGPLVGWFDWELAAEASARSERAGGGSVAPGMP